MGPVTFQVFGPQTIVVDGANHRLTQRRERTLLGLLVAGHGQAISAGRLIEELWDGEPPPTASTSLQVAISRIRRITDADRATRTPATRLISVADGYAIRAASDEVDVWQFETDARTALAAGPQDCVSRSDTALAGWRGAPYADCADTAWVRAEIERLGELRLDLIEARSAALLTLGHPDRVAAEVRPVAEQHPFREHLWSLLALAQYQTLRQADALATLRTLRARLDEDLGVDPSPEVQRLEQDLLRQSPELAAAARVGLSSAASVPPTTVRGPELVGRIDSLRTLSHAVDRLVSGIGGTMIISGEAGIGKSRLAASAAATAESRGITVLVGRCHEADVAPAYWPWLPLLRELADEAAPPEVMALLGTDTGAEPSDAGAAALRTYDAITRLISATARRHPLLLILEDLHWADNSSLRLLSYAAESLDAPVLIIVTRRTADVRVGDALTSTLASLARNGAERIRWTVSVRPRSQNCCPVRSPTPGTGSPTWSPRGPKATRSSCSNWAGCSGPVASPTRPKPPRSPYRKGSRMSSGCGSVGSSRTRARFWRSPRLPVAPSTRG